MSQRVYTPQNFSVKTLQQETVMKVVFCLKFAGCRKQWILEVRIEVTSLNLGGKSWATVSAKYSVNQVSTL